MKISTISTQNVDLGSTQTITGAKTAQNLTVTTNALNLSVGQITFPASQNASADANTLDDYEEGTWTPTISGSGTAGAGTYTTRLGTYTKLGRTVTAHWYTVISNHTGTTNIVLSGLPFTSEASTVGAVPVFSANLALTAGNIVQAQIVNSTTNIALEQTPTGGGASSAIPIDTAFTLSMTCVFTT